MKAIYPIMLSLFLLTGAVRGQKLVLIQTGQLVVAGRLETFADSTQQLRIAQINALYKAHRFTRLPGSRLLKNYTTANHWLHLRLPPAGGQLLYLEIDNPRIDQAHFYQLVGGNSIRQVVTGDLLPFSTRGFPHYNWIFRFYPAPGNPPTCL